MPGLEVGLLALVASDVALAAFVFTLWGRPRRLLGLLCTLAGRQADWHAGRLSETDEDRLLALADRLRLPALFGLFTWSFVVGGLLAAAGRVAVPIPTG